jgi:hypothetical protein
VDSPGLLNGTKKFHWEWIIAFSSSSSSSYCYYYYYYYYYYAYYYCFVGGKNYAPLPPPQNFSPQNFSLHVQLLLLLLLFWAGWGFFGRVKGGLGVFWIFFQ